MIELKFQKDVTSEYLIMKRQSHHIHTLYEEGILYNNQLTNLLRFSLRENNNETYYYNDIRYMRDLASEMECGNVQIEDIRLLLQDLKCAMEEMENYLLDKCILCLMPQCVFRDLKHNHFCFVCIPGMQMAFHDQMNELLSWLMKHMDYGNKALVAYIFELYRKEEAGEDIFDYEPEAKTDSEAIVQPEETESTDIEPIVFELENEEEDMNKKMPFQSIVLTSACLTLIATIFFVILGRSFSYWIRDITGVLCQQWIWPSIVFAAGMLITFILFAFYPDQNVHFGLQKPRKRQLKLPDLKPLIKSIIIGEDSHT